MEKVKTDAEKLVVKTVKKVGIREGLPETARKPPGEIFTKLIGDSEVLRENPAFRHLPAVRKARVQNT